MLLLSGVYAGVICVYSKECVVDTIAKMAMPFWLKLCLSETVIRKIFDPPLFLANSWPAVLLPRLPLRLQPWALRVLTEGFAETKCEDGLVAGLPSSPGLRSRSDCWNIRL